MAEDVLTQDPPYRRKVYDLLKSNFSDFKRTEEEFYKQLDTDTAYADKVYGVLSQNFSDFRRPKEEFVSMLGKPVASTPQEPKASPFGGGGAARAGLGEFAAPSPAPSETATLPPGNEQQAVDRFNVSAALGEDFVPKDAAEAALAVAANNIRRFAAPARKKYPYLPVEERPDRPSIEEYASQQYTPEMIQQKKEAGRWTASDQLRLDEVVANNASVDIKRRRYELARKVDAQGAVLPEDEAAMQQLETERAAAMSQYEQALKNFSGSGEQLALKQRQKESDAQFEQARKDFLSTGQWTQPSVIEHYMVRPAINALTDVAMNALGGASRMLDVVGNIPNEDGKEYYSPMAQFSDFITEGLDAVHASEAAKTKGELFGKDGEFRGDAALPNLIRTGVNMAALVGAGAAGGRGALALTSFLTTEEDYYREGIAAGLSPDQASDFSTQAAALTSALEGINPQLYRSGTVKGMMADRALKAIRDGKNVKEALKDATLFIGKEVGGENVQEFSQAFGDMLSRHIANQAMGDDRLDTSMSWQQAAETVIMTTALSGMAAGAARAADRPLYRQAIEWAVNNEQEMRQFIAQAAPPDQQEKLLNELDRNVRIYKGLPDLPGPERREVASAVADKERIKEEQGEATVDETVASITGDKFEQRLEEADARIAKAMGVSPEDLAKQEETKRLQEQYDKAKLKSEITGTPMPEGMTRPKDYVAIVKELGLEAAPPTLAAEDAVTSEVAPQTETVVEDGSTTTDAVAPAGPGEVVTGGDVGVQAPSPVPPQAPTGVPVQEPGSGDGVTTPYITRGGKPYGNFEVLYDATDGTFDVKMRGKLKDTWSKLPHKQAKKEKRRAEKAAAAAMRAAEREYAEAFGVERKRGLNAIEKNKEREKRLRTKALKVTDEEQGAIGIVLGRLASGQKVSRESVRKYLGWGAGRNEGANANVRKTDEEKSSEWALSTGGTSISELANQLYNDAPKDQNGDPLPGFDTADFEQAIAEVISGYKDRASAEEAYEAHLDATIDAVLTDEQRLEQYHQGILDGLGETEASAEETDAAIAEAENELDDRPTDEEADKFFGPRTPRTTPTTDESNEGQRIPKGTEGGEKSSRDAEGEGTGAPQREQDEERAILEETLAGARKELETYERYFKKQAESLFDKDAVESKKRGIMKRGITKRAEPSMFEAEGDTRANTAEDMEAGAKTLRDRVALAEKALAEYDAQAGAREKAAAKQTSIEEAPAQAEVPPTKKEEATTASFKRTDAKPVKEPTVLEHLKPKGGTETVEYAIKGFEEYPVVVVREAKGYRAFVKVGDVEVNISKGHPTEGIVVGDATEMLNRVGKEKLDATVERAMAAQRVKEEGPMEQRAPARDQAFNGPEQPKTPIGDTKTVTVDGKERTVFNSNGKPIHPTVEGVRNFWRWFGDSKVVDEQGSPLVVYHGTKADFDRFAKGELGYHFGTENQANVVAGSFDGANVVPVYLAATSLINANGDPGYWGRLGLLEELVSSGALTQEQSDNLLRDMDASDRAVISLGAVKEREARWVVVKSKLKSLGYDGISYPNKFEGSGTSYIVFDSSQIKSATGNSGAFDPKNPNITQQRPTDSTPIKTGRPRLDRVLNAMKDMAPGLNIIVHDTKQAYSEAVSKEGDGLDSSWGVYAPISNTIHVSPASPDLKQTLFHETAHPIILALARNNPDRLVDFVHEVRNHPDGKRYQRFASRYRDLSVEAQMNEVLAEFMGDVASGKVPVSTKPDSLWQRFKAFIKDILAALGWDMRTIDLSKPTNVREFAAQFKKAMDKGIRITGLTPVEGTTLSLQDDADRLVDGWYSRLDQAVAAKGNTQSGADWMRWAEARAKEGMLSMEEVKWTGLADFLQGKAKVTPKEVRDFLKENREKVEAMVEKTIKAQGMKDGGVSEQRPVLTPNQLANREELMPMDQVRNVVLSFVSEDAYSEGGQMTVDNVIEGIKEARSKYAVTNVKAILNEALKGARETWADLQGESMSQSEAYAYVDAIRALKEMASMPDDADVRAIVRTLSPRTDRGQRVIDPSSQRTTDRAPKTGKPNTDKALKALQDFGVKVIAPKNKQEYQKAIEGYPDGVKSSWGLYDHATRTIYINPDSKDIPNTLFHEAAHPILTALFHNNPTLRDKFFGEIADENMPGAVDADGNPVDMTYREYGAKYADKSIAMRYEEAIAQFAADVTDGKVKVSLKPDSLWQKFKAFIQEILAALGWDTRSIDLSNPKDVRAFAAGFAKAMNKGLKITGLDPVSRSGGAMLQDDADRLVDGWYSRLDQTVAAKGNTQSGADWIKWAEARAKEGALSMEEVKWTGLGDFLQGKGKGKGKGKVTPQQVREFLKENRVKVEVKILGAKTDYTKQEVSDYMYGRPYDELLDFERNSVDMEYDARLSGMTSQDAGEPKFSQYQLPGGTNYREVLVTLPNKQPVDDVSGERASMVPEKDEYGWRVPGFSTHYPTPDQAIDGAMEIRGFEAANKSKERAELFRSSHFDEPNILVHLRLNDRTDADGRRVLFIEELQSDFGQAHRKLQETIDKNFDDIVEKMKADGVLKKRCP